MLRVQRPRRWTNYAQVATLTSLRSIVFQAKRRRHGLASVDIKPAFLQSTPYHSSERPKYIKLKHAITSESIYFRLRTPMYGLRSSPRRWEDTLAPWLVSEGFKRGENEPSVFHRSSDDVTIICYVDDLLILFDHKDIEVTLARLRTRFEWDSHQILNEKQHQILNGKQHQILNEKQRQILNEKTTPTLKYSLL